MKHLSIDLETYSSIPIAKAGAYKYIQSSDFEILLMAYSVDGAQVQIIDLAQGEEVPDWLIDALKSPDWIKHAYNAVFEWYCLSKFCGEILPIEQWRDTMLHGLYCGFTAGLEATGEAIGLPEDKRKLTTGKALIRYFCVPCKPTKSNGGRTRNLPKHDPEKWQLFKEYCIGDVVTEMEIERRLSGFPVPNDIQEQWQTDIIINSRGVAIDMDLIRGALDIAENTREKLMSEAVELTGLENPNSVAQLSKWLAETTGEEIDNLRKDTVARMIDSQVVTGDAARVLKIRQELGKTSTKKYDAIEASVCEDNRVRGLLQFYGASRTGRWAGRLINVQNVVRTSIDINLLPMAREAVKKREVEKLEVLFGSTMDTLSQLIRTSFVASNGNKLIDADFSSIEARVVAWLAKEEWRLEVFRTHGKIYEASASQMFGVSIERIKKGNPEYELRQRGKIAELGLGFGGGSSALIAMGALDMGIPEDDLPDIVARWRQANPKIVDLWYRVENAALNVVQTGRQTGTNGLVFAREIDYANGMDFLTIRLPSGRKIYYAHPEIGENRWGKPSICYWGVDQTTKQWTLLETFGGKITENCLCGETKVLTQRGWIPLRNVTLKDKVWDGGKWVVHGGLIVKGFQKTIEIDGVKMTADHLVYTKAGWKHASSCEKYCRYPVALPDSRFVHRFRREKVNLEDSLRMRKRIQHARQRIFKRQAKIVRLQAQSFYQQSTQNSWEIKAPDILGLEVNERKMSFTDSPSLEELWRSRNQDLRTLVGKFREFLGGYVPDVSARTKFGSRRRKRRLLSGELSLDDEQIAITEQKKKSIDKNTVGLYNRRRSVRKKQDWCDNIDLSVESQMVRKYVVHQTGCYEQVYDLKNVGEKHCFTVLSSAGPMLVHNCVQAIARDCLAVAIQRLEAAGYPIVFHVHDEVVIDCAANKADLFDVVRIMTTPIPWANGLPMNADGWIGDFFRKD